MAKASSRSRKNSYNPSSKTSFRIFDDVLALVSTLARSRKDFGAEKLQILAEATRDYAGSMADLPQLQAYVESASHQIEGVSHYVMHTDVDNMLHDATTFARRHPLSTLALTVGVGIVASRLIYPGRAANAMPATAHQTRKKPRKYATRSNKANGTTHANA